MTRPSHYSPADQPVWRRYFAIFFGCFLGLALWKFGNPVILDHKVDPPRSLAEALEVSWPVDWGNWILLITGIVALWKATPTQVLKSIRIPTWLAWAPVAWLAWQLISTTRTVDSALSYRTLPQFVGIVVCFFSGLSLLAQRGWERWVLPGLLVVFAFSLVRGANQHHFEFRRDYELLREGEATGWTNFPAEAIASLRQSELILRTNGIDIANPVILEKLRKGRVHGTLVYPNAFAGAILLLLPVSLAVVLTGTGGLRPWLRGLVILITVGLGGGCLYWTGSKSGWLIAISMVALGVMMRAPLASRWKWTLAGVVVALGLTVFGLRFQHYFAAGATSVSARFDYWKAAVQVIREEPVFGTGPGTFQRPYARLKAPESEMARLTHNDYLQQASDSGIPGAVAYGAWILGALVLAGRKVATPLSFATYLGVAGWFAQGMSEFSLYIPALAWPAFTLLGILLGAPAETPSTGTLSKN